MLIVTGMPVELSGQTLLKPRPQERYELRPGDTLELQYRLTSDLNQTVVIQPDGYVSLNVAGGGQGWRPYNS